MSNQHDNIYNILGKLDALTPKQAAVDTVSAKTINESVEARGSVLAGVARVEARLAQQFAEANDWNNLGAEFRTTKPGTREPTHTGEKEYTKTGVRHHASKRYGGDRADDAETVNSTGEKRGRGRPKKSQFEGDMEEGNEFSGNRDDAIKAGKTEFEVDGKRYPVKENGLQRYTGIKKYGKDGFEALQKAGREGASEEEKGRIKDKYLPKEDMEEGQGIAESINFAEMMKEQHQTVDEYLMELQADIAEFKKSGHMSGKLRDSLEMHKFSKKQLTDEGGSYLNYADSAAENPAPREKPVAVVAPAPKPQGIMGRMGSAIAGGVKSAAGAVNKVIGHPSDAEMLDQLKRDTMKEELDELARLAGLSEGLTKKQKDNIDKNKNGKIDSDDFKRLRDKVSEASVDEDMIKSKKDDDKKEDDMEEGAGVMHFKAQQAKADGKDSFKLGDKEYPVKEGMAAMTEADLGNVAGYYKETQDVKKLTNWLEKNAGLPRNSPLYFDDVDLVYGDKTIVPGALVNPKLTFNDLLTAVVQALKQGSTEAKEGQLNELSPELLKRARDKAGEKWSAADDRKDKKASAKHNAQDDKFNSALRKKEKVDECGPEMSPFSSMGNHEAESGMSINSSMDTKTGRRTLSVTADGAAAEELAQMLKMAGMSGHSHNEPKAVVIQAGPEEAVEEEREGQYANTPDEEVENIDAILHQGNDLNREKEQYSTDRGRDNAMAIRREGIEMPKSLSRMLEAIKMVEAEKCNHTHKGEKCPVHGMKECSYMEEAKPSAGMSKGEKSSLVKKAKAGGDIGKPGKSFDKVAKAAGGGEKGKKIAAAAMWKNAAK